jgi:hypothetical protein
MATNTLSSSSSATTYPLAWYIEGGDAPDDNANTDGYKVTATQTFPVVPTDQESLMGGSCVEYLDETSVAMASTDTVEGAPVICHFIKFSATSLTTDSTEAQYLLIWSHAQWGLGTNPQTTFVSPGTAVAVSTYGVTFTPVNGSGNLISTSSSQVTFWYQPIQSSDYASGLRRYSKSDIVKAWNITPIATGS